MMSRGSMGKQIATSPSSKKLKKMAKGGSAASYLSPAVAIAESLKAGKPRGLAQLAPAAMAMKKNKDKSSSVGSVTGMKKGGKTKKMMCGGPAKKK